MVCVDGSKIKKINLYRFICMVCVVEVDIGKVEKLIYVYLYGWYDRIRYNLLLKLFIA